MSVFDRGNLIDRVNEPNLVVTNSRLVLAALLSGGGAPLTRFGVGSSAAPAATGNTLLTNYQFLPLGTTTNTAPGSVQFSFAAEPGDFLGMQISEFGLLTASNLLFARKVRQTPLSKTSDISFSGVWTISFQV